jgi:hypothetical protein
MVFADWKTVIMSMCGCKKKLVVIRGYLKE